METRPQTNERNAKRPMSAEKRQKLSELAKQRHKEGKFGGSEIGKLGGRPKKDRAAKRVAEAAQADKTANEIIAVFRDAIQPHQPMGIRIKAAEAWLGVEREEAKIVLSEEKTGDDAKTREELIALLSQKLTSGPASKIVREHMLESENMVEAVVVEEEPDA